MDPLSVSASIIALLQAAGAMIEYFSSVIDAPKECAALYTEATNLHTLLISLLYHVSKADVTKPWYSSMRALTTEGGILGQYRKSLEQFTKKVDINTTSTSEQIKKRAKWKFEKAEANALLERLQRLKSLVDTALGQDHFKLSEEIERQVKGARESLGLLNDNVITIKDDVGAIKSSQLDAAQRQQHEELLNWLCDFKYDKDFGRALSEQCEGTCQWFLQSPEFEQWYRGDPKILFCKGIPGAGKSVVAAVATKHLLDKARREGANVAYLFCSYKPDWEQNLLNILKTICRQLIQDSAPTSEALRAALQTHKDEKTTLDEKILTSALTANCPSMSRSYLVIDALDECSNKSMARHRLIALIKTLQSQANVKLLVTCRPLPELTDAFLGELSLDIIAQEQDIRLQLRSQATEWPRVVLREAGLSARIEDSIVEATEGMFLLVSLFFGIFADKRRLVDVYAALETIKDSPNRLKTAYNQLIERIEQMGRDSKILAWRAIAWATLAKKHLKVGTFIHALSIGSSIPSFDRQYIYLIEDVLDTCVGILKTNPEDDTIRFVHYTAQEYFNEHLLKWHPEATTDIALSCLDYLSLVPLNEDHNNEPSDTKTSLLKEFPLLSYASRYWPSHVRRVQHVDSVQKSLLAFLKTTYSEDSYHAMIDHVLGRWNYYSLRRQSKRERRLAICVKTGLTDALEQQLLALPQRNIVEFKCQPFLTILEFRVHLTNDTALRSACSLEFWIELKRHHTLQCIFDNIPLQREVVRANDWANAFAAAAAKGYTRSMEILFNLHLFEVNLCNDHGETALELAVRNDRFDTVQWLLARPGIDVNSPSGQRALPILHTAVIRCGEAKFMYLPQYDLTTVKSASEPDARARAFQILKLLLKFDGINLNATTARQGTALHIAVYCGNIDALRLLMHNEDVRADVRPDAPAHDPNSNVPSPNRRICMPLCEAARLGKVRSLRLLLGRDNITPLHSCGRPQELPWCPLARAALAGHTKCVTVMLDWLQENDEDWFDALDSELLRLLACFLSDRKILDNGVSQPVEPPIATDQEMNSLPSVFSDETTNRDTWLRLEELYRHLAGPKAPILNNSPSILFNLIAFTACIPWQTPDIEDKLPTDYRFKTASGPFGVWYDNEWRAFEEEEEINDMMRIAANPF